MKIRSIRLDRPRSVQASGLVGILIRTLNQISFDHYMSHGRDVISLLYQSVYVSFLFFSSSNVYIFFAYEYLTNKYVDNIYKISHNGNYKKTDLNIERYFFIVNNKQLADVLNIKSLERIDFLFFLLSGILFIKLGFRIIFLLNLCSCNFMVLLKY